MQIKTKNVFKIKENEKQNNLKFKNSIWQSSAAGKKLYFQFQTKVNFTEKTKWQSSATKIVYS